MKIYSPNGTDGRPGILNSVAGTVSTIVNVYTAQHGYWSITARVTITVTATCMTIMLLFFLVYHFILLARIKQTHEMDIMHHNMDHRTSYTVPAA